MDKREIETGFNTEGEYGDGFFFSDARLDSPNISEDTKPFLERATLIERKCNEILNHEIKISLTWEWNIRLNKWYPMVTVRWDGLKLGGLQFNLKECYQILILKDVDEVVEILTTSIGAILKLSN